MQRKIVLVLVLGVLLSGCIDTGKSITGTYVSVDNPDSYFTLYNNDTYTLHYPSGSSKSGHYVFNEGYLIFKQYYAGSDYIFEQEYKNETAFINDVGGKYVKK